MAVLYRIFQRKESKQIRGVLVPRGSYGQAKGSRSFAATLISFPFCHSSSRDRPYSSRQMNAAIAGIQPTTI